MSFSRSANEVVKRTQKMLQGQLIDEPRWLKAALKFPNTGSYVKAPSELVMDAPLPLEQRERMDTPIQILSSNVPLTGRATVRKLRFRPPKPQPIVYPEDQLRREFFEDHPFELTRPVSLVEGHEVSNSNWKALNGKDKSFRIVAEDVVKYQLALMVQGVSKEIAYERATRALSEHRVQEEIEASLADDGAEHFGVFLGKDVIQTGIEKEAEYLEKSRVAVQLAEAMRSSTEFTSEKSFKQEDEVINVDLNTPRIAIR